jgi:hypothetical protein
LIPQRITSVCAGGVTLQAVVKLIRTPRNASLGTMHSAIMMKICIGNLLSIPWTLLPQLMP